jgi:hypothetical protein
MKARALSYSEISKSIAIAAPGKQEIGVLTILFLKIEIKKRKPLA